ncbi:MAG: DUF2207 domain-containing protein [Halarsenatibacteraceae bacterium]
MNKKVIFGALCLIFVLLLGLNLNSVEAQQSYRIENLIIEMEVNKEGDFIITEEIEYNFLEGEFSTAHREVPGQGFSGIDFISISSIDVPLVDYNVDYGNSLEVDWEYPVTSDSATFNIEYSGREGLISKNGRNIVDWQAIGTDWDVPIENSEVKISLPEEPEDMEFTDGGQPTRRSSGDLYFQQEDIGPGDGWRLTFNFEEQVAMPEVASIWDYSSWLIGLLIIALILVIYRVIGSYRLMKPKAKNMDLVDEELVRYNEFSFSEKLILHDYSGAKGARMLAAIIFYLGKLNLIKLRIEIKDKFFGGEKAEIKLSLAEEAEKIEKIEEIKEVDDLQVFSGLFAEISDGDKKLEKVISKVSLWKEIVDKYKEKPIVKGWQSDKRKQVRKNSMFLGLFLMVISIGLFLDFVISDRVITFLPAVFAGILAIGEFIRYAVIEPLTDTAIKMREKIDSEIDERRDRLEGLVETDSLAALQLILSNLSWLLVDNQMTGSKFKKYRKEIEKNITDEQAESLEVPDWLAVDGLEGALNAIEVVEYTMTAVYAAVASTAATSGGAGGGAGGGGGGAG